jgi:uncharacterized membrane protein YhiD involved in acid resistance
VYELFQPADVATKLALSIGVGLLVGFEREWSQKELGVRIFALTALLGTISSLMDYRFGLSQAQPPTNDCTPFKLP